MCPFDRRCMAVRLPGDVIVACYDYMRSCSLIIRCVFRPWIQQRGLRWIELEQKIHESPFLHALSKIPLELEMMGGKILLSACILCSECCSRKGLKDYAMLDISLIVRVLKAILIVFLVI
jgi:hypothetical protein